MPICITVKGTKCRSTYAFLPSRIFLIMEGALVSETVPCPSRFESPCPCTIVSVRSSRVRLNLWFLWRVHARARTRRKGDGAARVWMGRRLTLKRLVSIERESCACRTGRHCGVTCATNACTAAVGRETNEPHFCRRETVRARRYCGRRRLKVRLDHCQIRHRTMTKGF